MFIEMPATFPTDKFQEFGLLSAKFFPEFLSNEYLADPLQRRQHSDSAWRAVAYRYRGCSESNEEFKGLFLQASELSREWGSDEEQNYKVGRCVYQFFMSSLSVFESLAYSLYFLGSVQQPADFPHVSNPKKITLEGTSRAFTAAFPQALLTARLAALSQDQDYKQISTIRNILTHRLAGGRSIRVEGIRHSDGTSTYTREETWHALGTSDQLIFDEELIQRPLNRITQLLTTLLEAAIEHVK
jgi:hypothetical protein